MKTAGTLLAAIALVSIAATPALAGKKKSKKKGKAPVAAEKQRRLCDELGLGIQLAAKSAEEPKKAIKMDDGTALAESAASFDLTRLDDRKSDAPTGEVAIQMEAQTVSAAQAGAVIKGHGGDLEYCWHRVPASKRDASAFTLHLTIDARGAVTSMSLGGDAPAQLSTCLSSASKRWEFPTADTTSEIDYPLSFK
jgi:hypothetical protein